MSPLASHDDEQQKTIQWLKGLSVAVSWEPGRSNVDSWLI